VSLRLLIAQLFAPGRERSAADRWFRVALVVSYMAAIFYVSGMSGSDIQTPVDDRISHTLAYAGLGILLMFAAAAFISRWTMLTSMIVIALGILYGASDELHQSFVPLRDSSSKDLFFDAIGTTLGVFIVRLTVRRSAL